MTSFNSAAWVAHSSAFPPLTRYDLPRSSKHSSWPYDGVVVSVVVTVVVIVDVGVVVPDLVMVVVGVDDTVVVTVEVGVVISHSSKEPSREDSKASLMTPTELLQSPEKSSIKRSTEHRRSGVTVPREYSVTINSSSSTLRSQSLSDTAEIGR